VRLGGLTIWRIQCTQCKAVFTVFLHFVLRYRHMRPDVARDALLATHGGLSLELCAVLYHISPMALYRLICTFGSQSLVTVLTRCGLPLPVYVLADEKRGRRNSPSSGCRIKRRGLCFQCTFFLPYEVLHHFATSMLHRFEPHVEVTYCC